MKLKPKRKTSVDDVRRVALAALVSALDDGKQEAKQKPGLTGARAVATGAVIYTAGRAAFKGQRFVREHLVNREEHPEEELEDAEERDEPEAEEELDEDEERDEPEAEADEDEDDGDGDDDGRGADDEPESDDRPGGSEEEEPVGEEDSDEPEAEGEDAEEERPRTPQLQPAPRGARKKGKQPSLSLPERPSRSRSPVARA